jgi:hypothetical protein
MGLLQQGAQNSIPTPVTCKQYIYSHKKGGRAGES